MILLAKDELLKMAGVLFSSISWCCLHKKNKKRRRNAASARKQHRVGGKADHAKAERRAQLRRKRGKKLPLDSCGRLKRLTGPEMPRHVWLLWDTLLNSRRPRFPRSLGEMTPLRAERLISTGAIKLAGVLASRCPLFTRYNGTFK